MPKVRILKHVMNWKPGDEVDVSDADAKALCTPSRQAMGGGGFFDNQKAMLVSDWKKLQAKPVEAGGLTQGELKAAGGKNIVPTPKDPAFEKQLKEKFSPSFKEEREERKFKRPAEFLEQKDAG